MNKKIRVSHSRKWLTPMAESRSPGMSTAEQAFVSSTRIPGHSPCIKFSLAMALSREFCPFWKWLAAEFRRLSDIENLDRLLLELGETADVGERRRLVTDICDEMHGRVVEGFGVDPQPTSHPHTLWCDRQELLHQTPKP